MKKDYKTSNNSKVNTLREAATTYQRKNSKQSPCQLSMDEINIQIEKGMEEKRMGLGTPHELIKKRFS